MSLAAGVSSYIVMTPEGRLGFNGPEVIEEESGVEEFDASDRSLIWSIFGGQQRYDQGLADVLVDDDTDQMNETIKDLIAQGVPAVHRSEQIDLYRSSIAALDPSTQWDPRESSWSAASLPLSPAAAGPIGRRGPANDEEKHDEQIHWNPRTSLVQSVNRTGNPDAGRSAFSTDR